MSCGDCKLCKVEIPQWDHETPDGVFIKQMQIPKDSLVPQHSHVYDHTSMLAVGAVRVWADNELLGDYQAPTPIFIKAKVKHTFLSLEDSVIYCIHKLRGPAVEIHEEHQLPGV